MKSLDPVEDLDVFQAYDLRLPPTTYDALQEAAQEEIESLEASKGVTLDPEHQRVVAYRQQLMDGTSGDDVKWLKLRAYHRAMDKLRAMNADQEASPEARKQLMEEYEVSSNLPWLLHHACSQDGHWQQGLIYVMDGDC